MTYPQGTWVQNPTGYPSGAWMYTGPVLFLPSNDAANTGMGILVLGPGGGSSNFPIAAQGLPGQSIVIDSATATKLASTASPTVVFTQVSPGGPGTAAHYTVQLGIPAGADGSSSSFELQNATDLTVGTAAIGMVPTVSSLGPLAFTLTTPPAVKWYSAGPFAATASNANTVKPVGSLAIPPQPVAGWLEIYAEILTIGAVDTQVNAVARITSTTGTVISAGAGAAGASPPPTLIQPNGLTASAGILAASTSATVFLNAENQTSSANSWNTAAGGYLSVKFCPTT